MRESFLHQNFLNQMNNSNNTKVIKLTKIETEKLTSNFILPYFLVEMIINIITLIIFFQYYINIFILHSLILWCVNTIKDLRS